MLLVAVLFLSGAAALHASQNPDEYSRTIWRASAEMPEDTIQAFAETPDGYLWIGTTAGLLRYDGSRFTTFNRDNVSGFTENGVFCLLTDKAGTLWIGTEGGGLLRYSKGGFQAIQVSKGPRHNFVRALMQDRSGSIWIGTDDGLFRTDSQGKNLTRIDGKRDFKEIAVHALLEDSRGTIWVGGSYLVAIGKQTRMYPLQGKYSENRIKSLCESSDGTIWAGTVSGLEKLAVGSDRFINVRSLHATVRVLTKAPNGGLWIGTIGSGLWTHRKMTERDVSLSKALPSQTVLSIFRDRMGNIWVGTEAGMVRFGTLSVHLLRLEGSSDFTTISRDLGNDLWIASSRLYHVSKDSAHPFDIADRLYAEVSWKHHSYSCTICRTA